MRHSLPPTQALRAFEAVARHASFTKAAEELHVTQSAVSHQIRSLEAHWGLRLFHRDRRSVSPTSSGRVLAPTVRDCFERVTEAVERLREEEETGSLRISLLQSFAVKWLMPRLPDFRTRNPAIQVWLSATSEPVDFDREEVDVAIRLGLGKDDDLHVTRLLEEEAFPVCGPAYRDRGPPLREPRDLFGHPLIQITTEAPGLSWKDWFDAAEVSSAEPLEGPHLSDSGMAMQAAIGGQGIALGRTALAADDLVAGRLVKLFDVVCLSVAAYHLVCPKGTEHRPKVAAFRAWLLEKSAETDSTYRNLVTGP